MLTYSNLRKTSIGGNGELNSAVCQDEAVLPDSAKDALRGINQDLSKNQPYTTLYGSADVATPLWVIPVAKSGNRIKEEPAK